MPACFSIALVWIDVDIDLNIGDFRLCKELILLVFLFKVSAYLFAFFIGTINVEHTYIVVDKCSTTKPKQCENS